MRHSCRSALFLTLAFAGSAFGSGSPQSSAALVGNSRSFYSSPICRQLGCVYQGVRRTRLEGSNSPVRIYQYSLPGGQQIEVTRYDSPGQPKRELIYNVRYLQSSARNTATMAARLASAAAGYPVTPAQVTPCLQRGPASPTETRFIETRGLYGPSVVCASSGTRLGISIQLP